jgi:hypothetical protein
LLGHHFEADTQDVNKYNLRRSQHHTIGPIVLVLSCATGVLERDGCASLTLGVFGLGVSCPTELLAAGNLNSGVHCMEEVLICIVVSHRRGDPEYRLL